MSETEIYLEYFRLMPGETYAILQAGTAAPHAGKYIGQLEFGEKLFLAFEISGARVRYYNPDHIVSLLPDQDPRAS